MNAIALRPTTPADSEFCFQLHKAAMGDYVHQGQGIGTSLITDLLYEARRRGQEVVLDVLAINQRAQALYQRLGFREVIRHGADDIKIMMRSTR